MEKFSRWFSEAQRKYEESAEQMQKLLEDQKEEAERRIVDSKTSEDEKQQLQDRIQQLERRLQTTYDELAQEKQNTGAIREELERTAGEREREKERGRRLEEQMRQQMAHIAKQKVALGERELQLEKERKELEQAQLQRDELELGVKKLAMQLENEREEKSRLEFEIKQNSSASEEEARALREQLARADESLRAQQKALELRKEQAEAEAYRVQRLNNSLIEKDKELGVLHQRVEEASERTRKITEIAGRMRESGLNLESKVKELQGQLNEQQQQHMNERMRMINHSKSLYTQLMQRGKALTDRDVRDILSFTQNAFKHPVQDYGQRIVRTQGAFSGWVRLIRDMTERPEPWRQFFQTEARTIGGMQLLPSSTVGAGGIQFRTKEGIAMTAADVARTLLHFGARSTDSVNDRELLVDRLVPFIRAAMNGERVDSWPQPILNQNDINRIASSSNADRIIANSNAARPDRAAMEIEPKPETKPASVVSLDEAMNFTRQELENNIREEISAIDNMIALPPLEPAVPVESFPASAFGSKDNAIDLTPDVSGRIFSEAYANQRASTPPKLEEKPKIDDQKMTVSEPLLVPSARLAVMEEKQARAQEPVIREELVIEAENKPLITPSTPTRRSLGFSPSPAKRQRLMSQTPVQKQEPKKEEPKKEELKTQERVAQPQPPQTQTQEGPPRLEPTPPRARVFTDSAAERTTLPQDEQWLKREIESYDGLEGRRNLMSHEEYARDSNSVLAAYRTGDKSTRQSIADRYGMPTDVHGDVVMRTENSGKAVLENVSEYPGVDLTEYNMEDIEGYVNGEKMEEEENSEDEEKMKMEEEL